MYLCSVYRIARFFLFLFNPETSHYLALNSLQLLLQIPVISSLTRLIIGQPVKRPKQFLGMNFRNGVGLAAGFDKDARWLKVWEALGFGFIEVGTVTPKPQPGNDKPRLFRLKKDQALINRMGFNNRGVEAMVEKLRGYNGPLIIGGNIGKNKVTPNEEAKNDYITCFRALFPHVHYIAVNVSSPNTPGLRDLQEKEPLTDLLKSLIEQRRSFVSAGEQQKPVLLKIAPDLTESQLDDIVEIVRAVQLDGLIVSNTTIARKGLLSSPELCDQSGGLSGAPVFRHSTDVLAYLRSKLGPAFPIIGAGGIMNKENGKEKITAGADLLQIYTGFIYSGPALVRDLANL